MRTNYNAKIKCTKDVFLKNPKDVYFKKGKEYSIVRTFKKGIVLISEYGFEFILLKKLFKDNFGKAK